MHQNELIGRTQPMVCEKLAPSGTVGLNILTSSF